MTRPVIDVERRRGRWAVVVDGRELAETFATQAEAREVARHARCALVAEVAGDMTDRQRAAVRDAGRGD